MAAQASSRHLDVEANQAAPSRDARERRHVWLLQGAGLAGLMLIGVFSVGGLSHHGGEHDEKPSGHVPSLAFSPVGAPGTSRLPTTASTRQALGAQTPQMTATMPGQYAPDASMRGGLPQMAQGLRPEGRVANLKGGGKSKVPTKQAWVTLIDAALVPPGTIEAGFVSGQEIAVANDGGKLYALSNKLPPTGQPANFGKMLGKGLIEEPITQTQFDMKTGKVVGPWCPKGPGFIIGKLVKQTNVPVFPVRKQGNSIQVQINVNAKAQFEENYWRGILDAQGKQDGAYY